jgi:hypothetical protein
LAAQTRLRYTLKIVEQLTFRTLFGIMPDVRQLAPEVPFNTLRGEIISALHSTV